MTELVFGAAGHIGAELVRQLAAAGRDVVAADIRTMPGERSIRCDITAIGEVLDTVRAVRPSRVYHLAAMLTGASEARPDAAFQINVIGLHNVLEAVRLEAAASLVFSSSVGTYGHDLPPVVDDLTLQRPRTHYGAAKLFGETLGRWYGQRFEFDFRAIRYAQIVAPGIRTPLHWAPLMLDDFVAGRDHVCESPPGAVVHAMSLHDAARATIGLADAPAELVPLRCYTVLGLPRALTAQVLADELTRRRPTFRVTFAKAGTPRDPPFRYSDHRARDDWGWRPAHDQLDLLLKEFRRST